MAGYSKSPLSKKLGLKENSRVRVENEPSNYIDLLQPLPEAVQVSNRLKNDIDIFHLLFSSKSGLSDKLQTVMDRMPDKGVIWVSWPKKAAGVLTDVTEDRIREAALPPGLVDIKVCAIDEVWS